MLPAQKRKSTAMEPELKPERPEQGQTMTEICRIYVHSHFTWAEFEHLADPRNIIPLTNALKSSMLAEMEYKEGSSLQMAQTMNACFEGDYSGPVFRWTKEELKNYLGALVVRSADWVAIAASFWEANDPLE